MSLIEVERDAGVAVVTLNDPERRNALSLPMIGEIIEVFDAIEDDESVGAVVVTGAPPAFCAGADLSHLGSSQEQGLRDMYEGFMRVSRCSLPTLAAVNGAAVGAGMNLALTCDVRLASRRARFDTRFVELGLHPGGGHTWMMQQIVGPQVSSATVLFGEILDAGEAERVGLVFRAVDEDSLMEAALDMARRSASGPRELVRRMKDTLRRAGQAPTHEEGMELEVEPQVWSVKQPEFAERIAKIAERISSKR